MEPAGEMVTWVREPPFARGPMGAGGSISTWGVLVWCLWRVVVWLGGRGRRGCSVTYQNRKGWDELGEAGHCG